MNELHLFAGAGGGILGGQLLGHRCVCAVEWEPYAQAVLVARQNDGTFPPFPIWDDVQTFDGRPWRGLVDVVAGGFPCQDISVAGKGAGLDGARSGMWHHMARIIGEVRPRYAFIENSPALIGRGLDRVLCDLAALGYDARWTVMGAADVGAPHKRERIWILANARGGRLCEPHSGQIQQPGRAKTIGPGDDAILFSDAPGAGLSQRRCTGQPESAAQDGGGMVAQLERCGDVADARCTHGDWWQGEQNIPNGKESKRNKATNNTERCCEVENAAEICDANSSGLEIWKGQRGNDGEKQQTAFRTNRWPVEPDVGRVVNGLAARTNRLKAIGNGQVPRVAATAFNLLLNQSAV